MEYIYEWNGMKAIELMEILGGYLLPIEAINNWQLFDKKINRMLFLFFYFIISK